MLMFIFYFFFMCSCYSFLTTYTNLLILIISLEMMVLVVFWGMICIYSLDSINHFLSLYFLSITVCDSSLALSLLIRAVRHHGDDKIKMISSVF